MPPGKSRISKSSKFLILLKRAHSVNSGEVSSFPAAPAQKNPLQTKRTRTSSRKLNLESPFNQTCMLWGMKEKLEGLKKNLHMSRYV